jgi:hypothetical protein
LAEHRTLVGEVLSRTEDEAAYALGAIFDNPAWSSVAFRYWDTVAAPWLDLHSQSPSARHPLYRGLRSVDAASAQHLVVEAIRWLAVHGDALDARFVLHPLLGRELDGETAGRAVRLGVEWLGIHGDALDARFVLAPLLGRELDGEAAGRAVRLGVEWLGIHGDALDAQFVLHPLLERKLGSHERAVTVEASRCWLDSHGDTPEAGYVLPPLLALVSEDDSDVRDRAERWVCVNPTDPGIGFVAKYLSRRGWLNERIATVLIQGARTNPGCDDLAWRLAGVAKQLSAFPGVIHDLLTVLETHLATLPPEGAGSINTKSEYDGLFEQLSRRLRTGIAAARLDDLLDAWLRRPEALSRHCSADTYFTALVSRILSLVNSGRFTPAEVPPLLGRLKEWIERWQCPGDPGIVDDARVMVANAEQLAAAAPAVIQPSELAW